MSPGACRWWPFPVVPMQWGPEPYTVHFWSSGHCWYPPHPISASTTHTAHQLTRTAINISLLGQQLTENCCCFSFPHKENKINNHPSETKSTVLKKFFFSSFYTGSEQKRSCSYCVTAGQTMTGADTNRNRHTEKKTVSVRDTETETQRDRHTVTERERQSWASLR